VQKTITNLSLLCLSIVLALGVLEILTRLAIPISPGAKNLTLDGKQALAITDGRYRHRADLVYRQVAPEFDTMVTIDKFGNRLTSREGSPEVIFLGDSFTFGHGIGDRETFAFLYCEARNLVCTNLGRSGTGTLVQLDILEHYLESENWRPSEVKLFLLVMTSTLMSGNDLLDNYYYAKVQSVKNQNLPEASSLRAVENVKAPSNTNRWLSLRTIAIKHSNLARVLYFQFAPMLRQKLSPAPKQSTLDASLLATKNALVRLAFLGQKFGFRHTVYVLHPVQDILQGTDQITYEAIKQLRPSTEVLDTADIFEDNPTDNYFSFDGHFNKSGAKRVSEFLIQQHAK
jgi:hypothetical protein